MIFVFLLALLAPNSTLARADEAPAQLNIPSFVSCLEKYETGFDFETLSERYHYGVFDLLLPYLAIYPGTHLPAGLTSMQRQSESYWQTPWEKSGSELAHAIADILPSTPSQAFALAVGVCPAKDIFCAALNLQNVFKTLGRHEQAIAHDPLTGETTDYNPDWFKNDASKWLKVLPAIQDAMISLRTDQGGDRFGEWYHFFGILAFGTRDLALGKDESSLDFTVRMNQVLNPLIAGETENPLKARFDRDSAEVVWDYLQGQEFPQVNADLDCGQRGAFANERLLQYGARIRVKSLQ